MGTDACSICRGKGVVNRYTYNAYEMKYDHQPAKEEIPCPKCCAPPKAPKPSSQPLMAQPLWVTPKKGGLVN